MTRPNLASQVATLRDEVAELRDQLAKAAEVERILRRAGLPESLPAPVLRRPPYLRPVGGGRS